jgi:hypothetical protein
MYAINGDWSWVGMKDDVSAYIRTCEVCQMSKKHRRVPKPPVKPIVANEPLERVEIDFTEYDYADPDTGHRYVLTVVCCCSKFLWVKTFATKHAAPVAQSEIPEVDRHERSDTHKQTGRLSDLMAPSRTCSVT